MFGWGRSTERNRCRRSGGHEDDRGKNSGSDGGNGQKRSTPLSKSMNENVEAIKDTFHYSSELKVRYIRFADKNASIIYLNSLVDDNAIADFIIRPMAQYSVQKNGSYQGSGDMNFLMDTLLNIGDVSEEHCLEDVISAILTGNSIILLDGSNKALAASTIKNIGRMTNIPTVESSVKGAQEGFVENDFENMGLLRRNIRDPNLIFERFQIGRTTKTFVNLVYIKGITNEELVEVARKRLNAIDSDGAINAAQVYHEISDKPHSIFPLMQTTERVDKVVSSLLDGRIAIMVENTPNVFLAPVTLPIMMQSIDDYYEKWIIGTAFRFLRYLALFISTLLPSLYIAITSFSLGVLPTNIVLAIAGTRLGVPFPAFVEAFLMTLVLEMLQEAGIRLPKVVGQTVSIVGGLVIGQAAVQAGVVSPVMVIVIAITAVSSFAIPDYSLGLATRILRLPFMVAGTVLGLVGTSIMLLTLLGYTASLESFGVGYLEPVTPFRMSDWKDSIIRGPQDRNKRRPEFLEPENRRR